MIDILGKQISKDIYTAVKKATMHFQKQDATTSGIADFSLENEELKQLIFSKVDRTEFMDMINRKSNKTDTEATMRWIEILHN